ncbi:MAG: ABC transporter permease [Chloroflexi bacterium]|nr:ABC transporter permease [Chloroflexota bacterium]
MSAVHNAVAKSRAPGGAARRPSPLASAAGGYVLSLLLGLIAIAVWQAVADFSSLKQWLLPSPWEVIQAFAESPGLIMRHAAVTAEEALIGFAVALAVGAALAVAISQSRLAERALYPYVVASQAVPVIAIAPVLVVWFGFSLMPKIIVIVLITFFPITINMVDGIRSVDPDLVSLMRSMGATRWQVFKLVQMPSALPYFFSGAKVAAAVSVIGAIFGEWVGANEGLGYFLKYSSAQFLTARVFASIVVLALMGLILFSAVAFVERKALPWAKRPSAQN